MTSLQRLGHVLERRKALSKRIDAFGEFEAWEETCVPSYVHPNPAAAGVSWCRLFAAVDLAARHTRWGPVLDFGASVGELGHVLPAAGRPYWFVEQQESAAVVLKEMLPEAVRTTLEDAPADHFAAIFALDSLEHNTDYAELLEALRGKLAPDGVLVLSGPTENALYKLGRRIAGYEGHYHETNIHAIEARAEEAWQRVDVRTVPAGVPLFRISVWRRR